MANQEYLDILNQGVEVWNKWRKKEKTSIDIIGADFSHLNLAKVDFSNVILEEINFNNTVLEEARFGEGYVANTTFKQANLKKATLSDTLFMGSNFQEATMMESNLGGTIFTSCNFNFASIKNADLSFAIFRDSTFDKTSIEYASLWNTVFADCDLSKIKGLTKTLHEGPSTIGLDTLIKSQGKISEIFLKKAGVPDVVITYAKSLIINPIEFYSCFISFTEKDSLFSERLYNDMQGEGIRCWRWTEDAKWGKTLRKSIDEAVRVYDKLVVICSKNSLNSPPVLEEIEKALNKEDAQVREGKEGEVLFPIMIDNYIFDGWEHYLRDRLLRKTIGDFKGWRRNPEKYDKAVKRLVKDLNKHI